MSIIGRMFAKDQKSPHRQSSADRANPISHPSPASLQRKASCACGGDCPRCQAKHSNLSLSKSPHTSEVEADEVLQMALPEPLNFSSSNNKLSRKASTCNEEVKLDRNETGNDSTSFAPRIVNDVLSSGGKPLDAKTRASMESRFDHDFSQVRIHDDTKAAGSARSINALAYTSGHNIVFSSGRYNTDSHSGKRLLAHELAHVVQQNNTAHKQVMRAVDDAKVEAEFNKWADENKKVKDKTSKDFPWAVWDFIRPKIVNDVMEPLPKPKDAKKLQEWEDNFARAEIISRWLFTLKSTTSEQTIKDEADSKAYNILDSLAKAGFVSKAIAQSGYLDKKTRTLVYDTILKNPSVVAASEFETIINFQCQGISDPASVPIVQTFTDGNTSPLKTLGADNTKAILKVLVTKYGSHSKIIDAIAEVLMFNPGIRKSISDAMMASEFGNPELLFKVLQHKFFIEPEYGASLLANLIPTGMSSDDYDKQRMTKDMPWVYTYKQKFYVQYLIDLAKGQNVIIPKPASMNFSGLKTWLDANTEKIGEAAKAKYPSDPQAVFDIYKNIADIFFYHIPHDRDVEPDLEGKIGHLKEGAPSKMRFEADCDVFATYAMRLFYNAGFDPIGYMAYVPVGAFSARAAHVSALIRKDNKYYIINNKGILDAAVSETKANEKKEDALKSMRKKALRDAYEDPLPTDLKIYYEDAGTKGKMSKLFKNQDSSLERADLL